MVSMFGLFLYLLTSSDSGSLIIDTLASNGDNVSFLILKFVLIFCAGLYMPSLIFVAAWFI